ncbi:glycosyltransferase family 2 protein [Fulvivirgaceae bacterium LMO-SS25]
MQNSPPLVTVIVLCFNQAKYLREAVQSVMEQDYKSVEIIIVDDASTDRSREVAKEILSDHPEVKSILLEENLGNCRAFNRGLQLAGGKYVIDLAADDLLMPNRIKLGVRELEAKGEKFGVHFSDAYICDENAEIVNTHYSRDGNGKLLETVPQGEVYVDLLARYFICAPTMMMRKSMLNELGGYNEELSYEDFDFWIRSSRNYQYAFSDDILVKKRNLPNSLSKQQYRWRSKHFESTYKVCKMAFSLNRNATEHKALRRRILYETKMSLKNIKLIISIKYLNLMLRTYL